MSSCIRILLFFCTVILSNALIDVNIDQSISDAGFHRSLKSNITIYGNLSACYLAIEEKFPKNFFLQDYDLNALLKDNVGTKLSVPLCTEATATNASPFSLYLYLNDSLPITTSNEFHTRFFYDLKTHIRYHDPKKGGGRYDFKKQPAILFARCPEGGNLPTSAVIRFPCNAITEEICDWHTLPVTHKHLLPPLSVPTGDTDLYQKVFLITHITAYAGVFILLYFLFKIPIH